MKISDLEFFLVDVPRSDSVVPLRSLLVRLASDDGHEGWGEAALAWRPGELADRRRALLPGLAGRSVFQIEELARLDLLRPASLRAAVEMASWDMIGRALGEPICHLMGGPYRARIPIAARLPQDGIETVVLRARELADRGFHAQVVPGSGDAETDGARIVAVLEALGERVELRVDGLGRLDAAAALALCQKLERHAEVRHFVDPIAGGDLARLARLRQQTAVAIGARMLIDSPARIVDAARQEAAELVVVDMARVGGLSAARACGVVAEAAGMIAALDAGESVGPAAAALLQVAASTPAFSTSSELSFHELRGDVLAERIETVDGMMATPEGPGLGVEISRAKIERYLAT